MFSPPTVVRGGSGSARSCLLPIFRSGPCRHSTGIAFTVAGSLSRPAPRLSIQPQSPSRAPTLLRYVSTVSDSGAAVAGTKLSSSDVDAAKALDWNAFFQLRKTRRRWQQGFSVIGAVGGGTGGAMLISTGAVDALASQLPLDPMVSLGLMTLAVAALGWVVGPSLGNVIFNMLKRKHRAAMAIKETQFFTRIKKHRADPTSSSMNNPVPDFYGEKISSVTGYRQWLKDQRAFKKKKTTFL